MITSLVGVWVDLLNLVAFEGRVYSLITTFLAFALLLVIGHEWQWVGVTTFLAFLWSLFAFCMAMMHVIIKEELISALLTFNLQRNLFWTLCFRFFQGLLF